MSWSTISDICRMIKIEHSIFALPYAWAGACLAAGGMPPWLPFIGLTVAMVAVRSFAMTWNRIVDIDYDRDNPRTCARPLVTGAISLAGARAFCAVAALIFVLACAFINSLCLWLSIPTLAFVAIYSYLKRITSFCHFWLGATLGLAPLAGWISVLPGWPGLPAVMLFFAVTFWVAAFDVYYSFQDLDFDTGVGLHSLPADFGGATALALAGFSHIMTFIFLVLCGISASLGWPWYVVCLLVGVLLLVEHRLVKPEDLRYVNVAFFTINGFISPLLLLGVILGIYF